jgi:hypothetical protein
VEEIGERISARIPDENTEHELYSSYKSFSMVQFKDGRYIQQGKCQGGFPNQGKDSFAKYQRMSLWKSYFLTRMEIVLQDPVQLTLMMIITMMVKMTL